MTVANKPGTGGEHEASVKTSARGMPGCSGVTVVTNARVYYTPRAAAGASSARRSPRPLISESGTLIDNLARNMRRDREAVSKHGGLFETCIGSDLLSANARYAPRGATHSAGIAPLD